MRHRLNSFLATAAAILSIALAACQTTPQSPAQTVYAIHGTYAAALTVAVEYRKLPPCVDPRPLLCSEAKVVKDLQTADDAAFTALSVAQSVVRDPKAPESKVQAALRIANQAVSALSTITANLKVK